MQFANQRWFDQPSARREAIGDTLKGFYDPIRFGSNNGGIIDPQPIPLERGTTIVRFGGLGTVVHTMPGGWWIELDQFRKIEQHADRARISVQAATRIFCCVPAEWNDLSMLVQATLGEPLMAYAGLSKPVDADGRVKTAYDGKIAKAAKFRQLFIPGMASGDLRRDALNIQGYGSHVPSKI